MLKFASVCPVSCVPLGSLRMGDSGACEGFCLDFSHRVDVSIDEQIQEKN